MPPALPAVLAATSSAMALGRAGSSLRARALPRGTGAWSKASELALGQAGPLSTSQATKQSKDR
eukprot:10435808-Lingulodinium_polyedra.AAC.1